MRYVGRGTNRFWACHHNSRWGPVACVLAGLCISMVGAWDQQVLGRTHTSAALCLSSRLLRKRKPITRMARRGRDLESPTGDKVGHKLGHKVGHNGQLGRKAAGGGAGLLRRRVMLVESRTAPGVRARECGHSGTRGLWHHDGGIMMAVPGGLLLLRPCAASDTVG